MNTHPIPGDKSRIDRSFEVITDRNLQILLNIAQNASSGKVHEFYTSCMNLNQIEQDGLQPLLNLWGLISGTPSNPNIANNVAAMLQNGISAFFEFGTEIDSSDPAHVIYSFRQGGYTLPDPSYYEDDTIYPLYVQHIANMFTLAGADASLAPRIADFERYLANMSVPQDELFDPFTSFNKMTWPQFFTLAGNFMNWDNFANALRLNLLVPLTADAPDFFSRLSIFRGSFDNTAMLGYMKWRILHWAAPRLPSAFVTENFNFFGKVLGGLSQPQPRTKTCMSATDAVVPELTGKYFEQVAFPPSSERSAGEIFDAILTAFEINVQKLDWMDPVTRQRATEKLNKIMRLIGGPSNPRNYTGYTFGPHYMKNVLVATQDEFRREMASAGQASDRTKWEMSADTVNAYYSPNTNSMVFPAGILQAPFYSPEYPSAMNYGGIGMVGGHELTHSLDSQGRDFNGDGKLEDWWAPQTSAEFQKRVDCIIGQYSKFSPLPGFYVNGNLTQGENIADAGGLKTAHTAYSIKYPNELSSPSIVPGLNNEQLFFVGFAQTWCSKLTPAAIKVRLLTDPHSPPRFRVNGAAMNLPAFSKAFQCGTTAPMNPSGRCQIW